MGVELRNVEGLAEPPGYSHVAVASGARLVFTAGAVPLMAKAGVAPAADEGLSEIVDAKSVDAFIVSCRKLRLWAREPAVKMG